MKALRMLSVTLVSALCAFPSLAATKDASKALVERGRYLVIVGACNDCHSPKKPGGMEPEDSRMLSGRPATTQAPAKPANMGEIATSGDLTAWNGPWGVSYTANLTPDPKTGLARRYNEASFIKTIRTGKKPEGEPLLPPMPWQNYAQMSDADLKAVWAFLQTIKPIENNVKVAVPAKPAAKK